MPDAGSEAGAVAVASPAAGLPQGVAPVLRERCPLCGAEIDSSQDWCLGCGAAARTRLAATPRWWLPISALGVVVIVSICVLVASLVKFAS
jgi:hypothetical protein